MAKMPDWEAVVLDANGTVQARVPMEASERQTPCSLLFEWRVKWPVVVYDDERVEIRVAA